MAGSVAGGRTREAAGVELVGRGVEGPSRARLAPGYGEEFLADVEASAEGARISIGARVRAGVSVAMCWLGLIVFGSYESSQ